VKNYLGKLGMFVKPRFKTQLSENNRQKRVQYCERFGNFSFKKVLFTDESSFQLNTNTLKVFQFKGQKPPQLTKHNPNVKIMVWGGISYWGKTSLHVVEENLNGEGYLKLLKKHRREMLDLFEGRGLWRFQQDNAPCHRTKKVKNYIKRWLTPNIHPHPAQSPDLNPIELIWAQMKTLVENKKPTNKRELLNAILSSWDKITRESIRKCIHNLHKKMDSILDNNGDLL